MREIDREREGVWESERDRQRETVRETQRGRERSGRERGSVGE